MAKTASKTESGIIDMATMREFDVLCLTPDTPIAPEEIEALRERIEFDIR